MSEALDVNIDETWDEITKPHWSWGPSRIDILCSQGGITKTLREWHRKYHAMKRKQKRLELENKYLTRGVVALRAELLDVRKWCHSSDVPHINAALQTVRRVKCDDSE